MAQRESRKLALMSIHSEYADTILAGQKKVEFRRRTLNPSITHVLIYATKPRSEIVGVFEVAHQEVMSPEQLWDEMGGVGCISAHKFDEYFSGAIDRVGIRIGCVTAAEKSVPLRALGVSRPPQSVQYLDLSLFDALAILCPKVFSAD